MYQISLRLQIPTKLKKPEIELLPPETLKPRGCIINPHTQKIYIVARFRAVARRNAIYEIRIETLLDLECQIRRMRCILVKVVE